MKTRSNMPLFVVECDNVKTLSNSQIDLLRCGDYLVKKDASGEHAYKVTFKSDTGLCLTYHDASVIETQSYDKIEGVWTYNSEDKTPNLLETQTEDDVKALIEGGTLENAKPIYCHPISLTNETTKYFRITCLIFTNDATPFTRTTFKTRIDNLYAQVQDNIRILASGGYYSSGDSQLLINSWLFFNGNSYGVAGVLTDGTVKALSGSYDELFPSTLTFTDGVNKIN